MRKTVIILPFLAGAWMWAQKAPTEPSLKMFGRLPAQYDSKSNPATEKKVALGRMLYYEPRLSRDHKVSCNSCHQLDKFGVDGTPTSEGFKGQHGNRNAPTVFNAAGHFVQFWDGRAADVEAQAKGPVLNPVEMAAPDAAFVERVLKSMPGYVTAFKAAFPGQKDPVTFDNAALAIAAFERKLVTPSRWDRYQAGDKGALSAAEVAGFKAFVQTGCATCHNGPLVGASMYQKAGTVQPWPNTSDKGRMGVTKSASDAMMFKVPTLRNIEKTGPYFHDGSVPTLDQAVKMMAEHQLGKQLAPADTQAIVGWLKTLTGQVPPELVKQPNLPESTKDTPAADRG
jgi:cytochrome c peroxidase